MNALLELILAPFVIIGVVVGFIFLCFLGAIAGTILFLLLSLLGI